MGRELVGFEGGYIDATSSCFPGHQKMSFLETTRFFLDTVITVSRRNNPGTAILLNVLPAKLPREAVGDKVRLWHWDRTHDLRPVWIGQGFPADVKRALKEIQHEDSTTTVVTCRRLSRGAREILEERDIPWADAAGYAEIEVHSFIYISRLRPTPLRQSVTSGVTWSRATEAIAESILSRKVQKLRTADERDGVDRVASIAESTGISNAQVSKVLVMFDDEGYTRKVGPERGPTSAREFRDAGRLLSDWAGHYSRAVRKERRIELHVPWRDHSQSISLADNLLEGTNWAISGWAAAESIAPFTTHVPDLTMYVPDDHFDRAAERLTGHPDVSEVDRGGRIHLRAAAGYLFDCAASVAGVLTASPIRVYADLIRNGDRGAEVAEHLREVAIEF